MYKLAIPLFILLLLCPPAAIAVLAIGGTIIGITRLAKRQTPEARRAANWYANV